LNKQIWVVVGGIVAVRFALALFLPLSPQEAYYWNYSRHLALSYFDHPPFCAWSIWIFTELFGDTVFAIRLPALLYSLATFWALYGFTRRLAPVSLGGVLPLLLSPFFFVGGMQMLPDSPLLFFHVLALTFGYRAAVERDEKSWYGFGASAGLALLSKYSAIFIFAGLGFYILLASRWKILASLHFWLSILLTAVIFTPVLIWNAQHNWASFLFQSFRRAGELGDLSFYNFGRYLVTQILVLSLKVSFAEKEQNIIYITSWILPFLLVFSLVSFFYWVKLNWLWPGYLTATALTVYLVGRGNIQSWFKAEFISSSAVTLILVFMLETAYRDGKNCRQKSGRWPTSGVGSGR
jgi:dolichol-phosphate mannosyltransferase